MGRELFAAVSRLNSGESLDRLGRSERDGRCRSVERTISDAGRTVSRKGCLPPGKPPGSARGFAARTMILLSGGIFVPVSTGRCLKELGQRRASRQAPIAPFQGRVDHHPRQAGDAGHRTGSLWFGRSACASPVRACPGQNLLDAQSLRLSNPLGPAGLALIEPSMSIQERGD